MSCGLALAEFIASLSKPTVALVIGDSHSIGVPLSVAADYTVIAPSADSYYPSGTDEWTGSWGAADI